MYVCGGVWVFYFSHLCMKHELGDACGGEGEKQAPSLSGWLLFRLVTL